MAERLNIVGTEFIFETIKILTLESEFIKIITTFEFDLLNNKEDEFFIMKHLLIEYKYPINKNFCLKLLTTTLTVNKNQGCQEKN